MAGASVGAGLVRIVEAELVEGEADPAGDVQGRLDRLGPIPEEAHHLGRRLEPALGVLEKVEAHLVDAPAGAKAGEHVGDGVPVRPVHEDRVRRDKGHSGGPGGTHRLLFARIVRRRRQPPAEREPHLPGKGRSPGRQQRGEPRRRAVRGQHDQHHPLRRGEEVAGAEHPVPDFAFASASAFDPLPARARAPVPAPGPSPRPRLGFGQQPGKPPVGGPVARVGEHGWRVREVESRADERPEARRARRRVDPHHTGERVVVRDPEGLQTEVGGLPDQLLGMGGAPQEGVVRDRLPLHVANGIRACACAGNGSSPAGGAIVVRRPAHLPPLARISHQLSSRGRQDAAVTRRTDRKSACALLKA